jgi:hypothetical protein
MALIGREVILSPRGEGVRAGVEDGSGNEAVSEFVAQPGQVPRVGRGHPKRPP